MPRQISWKESVMGLGLITSRRGLTQNLKRKPLSGSAGWAGLAQGTENGSREGGAFNRSDPGYCEGRLGCDALQHQESVPVAQPLLLLSPRPQDLRKNTVGVVCSEGSKSGLHFYRIPLCWMKQVTKDA